MFEDKLFQEEDVVRITAASVGISKKRWAYVSRSNHENDTYSEIMIANRFDHLPILDDDGRVRSYYKTTKPNDFSEIEKFDVSVKDLISYDTPIQSVINQFVEGNRSFFFLSNQRSINGLITVGNLNCKQVQIYVFSLVCELERALGEFLNDKLPVDEIKNWVIEKSKSSNGENKYAKMLLTYESLVEDDLENLMTEHFFFVDFFKLFYEKKLYRELNYSSSDWKRFKSVNELRNRIAHPTRNLLDSKNNVVKLKERLDKVDDLLFRLRNYPGYLS